MRVQVSPRGLRLRLERGELDMLIRAEPVVLRAANWVFTLARGPATLLADWPASPRLALGPKDFDDLLAEPENGIVLSGLEPVCEVDVDRRG